MFGLKFRTSSAKLKMYLLSSQLSIHLAECVHFVIDILAIQKNPNNLVTINLGTNTLANNLGGEYKVLEHILMHSGKSTGTRPLLGDTRSPGWRWENAAQAKEDDMPVREFLLEFTSKALLYMVELREKWHWNEDDDSFLSSTNLNLSCTVEL